MNANTSLKIVATLLAMISGTAVLAESQAPQIPVEGAQAFLTSHTSLTAAIAAAEAATGGKVASIAYQSGVKGAPDAILAHIMLADGTEKTVALNPADGTVMSMKVAATELGDSENEGDNGSDTGESETGNN